MSVFCSNSRHDVGAYAVSYYARPRNTGDIDFFVNNSSENISNLLKVLKDFGFGTLDLSPSDFEGDDNILQLGYEPVRINVMTGISGISFQKAYKNEVSFSFRLSNYQPVKRIPMMK